ncbi:unnamed protein product [Rotaria sp. Silwood1]|nr:unnamed protein product [Rotaria sp. Silwood1]
MLNNIILATKTSDVHSNQSEVEQQTELMYKDNTIWTAVFNADKAAIDRLIDADADVINMIGAVGECPIHMLFLYGTYTHLKIARDLIIRFPMIVTQIYNKPTESNDNTILHMLVICNLPEMYAKFKARWIEQQTVTDQKLPRNSKSIEITKLWNRFNKDGLTPLTLAADLGRAKMLSWLLYERKKIQWSYGNVSCVLHPLDQLDLDFQKEGKQRPLSVLEIMIKNNDPELIHSIITSLIDKKWKQFAYRTADENDKTVTTDSKNLDFSRQIISAVGHFIVIEGALWKSAYEINEMSTLGLWNYWNSTGSIFLEDCLACSFCFCIFTVQTLRLFDMQHETVILAVTSLLGWSYMFFFTMPFRFTGPFVIMIYKMLFNDVLRFYYYTKGPYPLAGALLLILYVVVISILLLNLLIAMMGDTYTDVKKRHLERARIALNIESRMSTSKRQLNINKYWVDVQGERYLQVEQVNDALGYPIGDEANDDE